LQEGDGWDAPPFFVGLQIFKVAQIFSAQENSRKHCLPLWVLSLIEEIIPPLRVHLIG